MGTSNVTLADVAAHLGVSRTTVSNAYNRPNQLSPKLREKVLAAANDLGYCGPDPGARGLQRGRTGSLGFGSDQPLTYVFTDPAATLFLQGMAAGFEEHGAALALIPRMPEGPERSAELVRSALVDGYMMFCTATDDPRLSAVRGRGLPYVLIEYEDDPTAAHVQIDDVWGGSAPRPRDPRGRPRAPNWRRLRRGGRRAPPRRPRPPARRHRHALWRGRHPRPRGADRRA